MSLFEATRVLLGSTEVYVLHEQEDKMAASRFLCYLCATHTHTHFHTLLLLPGCTVCSLHPHGMLYIDAL